MSRCKEFVANNVVIYSLQAFYELRFMPSLSAVNEPIKL